MYIHSVCEVCRLWCGVYEVSVSKLCMCISDVMFRVHIHIHNTRASHSAARHEGRAYSSCRVHPCLFKLNCSYIYPFTSGKCSGGDLVW